MFTKPTTTTSLEHIQSMLPKSASVSVRLYEKPEKEDREAYTKKSQDLRLIRLFESSPEYLSELPKTIEASSDRRYAIAETVKIGGETAFIGFGDFDDVWSSTEMNYLHALCILLDASIFGSSSDRYHIISNRLLTREEFDRWNAAMAHVVDPCWREMLPVGDRALRVCGGTPIEKQSIPLPKSPPQRNSLPDFLSSGTKE